MPIEIVFQHQPQDVAYAVIGQGGYGRMDETTTIAGIAAFNVSTSTAIIGHCPKFRRTVVIHSENYMFVKDTLEPIFDWIIGKGEEIYTENNTFEVVVLCGFLHRDKNVVPMCDHPKFMDDFSEFLRVTYDAHSINIVDAEPLITSSKGSLLVDKITAKITILRIPLSLVDHTVSSTSPYSERQLYREMFARDLFPLICTSADNTITNITRRHLQFDINQYTLHGSISDCCRLLLRWKCGLPNQTDMDLLHLLKRFNIALNFVKYDNLKEALGLPASSGLPCERCPNAGSMKCSNCCGAWYCGRDHQVADWPQHKQFCKSNKINK